MTCPAFVVHLFRQIILQIFTRLFPICALIIFLSFSAPVNCQTSAEGDSSSVVVHVLHQGRPVAGAEVYRVEWKSRSHAGVYAAAARIGQSGEDGTISVPVRIEHGKVWGGYRFVAQVPGRLTGFTGMFAFNDTDSAVINLFPSRTVSGVVRDDRGKPIPGAEITIWNIIGNGPAEYDDIELHQTTPGSSAKSDSRGRFTLSGMPDSSRITIYVSAPGRSTLCVRDIPSGMNTLDLRLEPESRITGRVTFENGKPVKGIGIGLREKLFNLWNSGDNFCVTDSAGCYTLGHLPSGMYMVTAYPDSTLRDWVAPPQKNIGVGRGKTAENINIRLVKGVPLTGMVVEENTGEPVPGVRVSAVLLVPNPSDQDNGVLYSSLSSGLSDEKGMYRLPAIPGDIEVRAQPPEGYLRRMPPQRVTVEPLDSLVQGVNLSVARAKTIRGVVKMPDGSPASEVEIFCGSFTMAYTDEKGTFEIHGIRAGGEIPYCAYTRKRDMEASFTVNVDSIGTAEVVLQRSEFVSVEGIVVDSQEKPVSGMQVNLSAGTGAPPVYYGPNAVTTDSTGRFRMDRIRAGKIYQFVVRDGLAASESFLAGKDTKPLNITMPEADRWLEGMVRNEEGKPIAGMMVDIWGKGHTQTTTDSKGRFRLEGLASEHMEITFRSVQGRFNFQNVPTNRRRDFSLPTGRHYLSGQVTDTRGKPLDGAFVNIACGEKRPLVIETDSCGFFYLSDLEYTTVTITAVGPGHCEQIRRMKTDREDVRFRLAEAGRE
jgi:protocatechuate 3,4-dioxygenase beta subunit